MDHQDPHDNSLLTAMYNRHFMSKTLRRNTIKGVFGYHLLLKTGN